MIQQPELGKKISHYRKAKGLTQEELVEKCNLNVRTLQRIEAGEVTPRSYTVKLIFEALELNYDDSFKTSWSTKRGLLSRWLKQNYIRFIDLFNLKTNTMKKVSILSITFIAVIIGLFAFSSESSAQKAEKAISAINELQSKSNNWINEGKVDSVMTLYREDASILPYLPGKNDIRYLIQSAVNSGYKLIDFQTMSISVGDSIAVQKYFNTYTVSGKLYKQKGMAEWRLKDEKWLIVNDIFTTYQ